MRRAEERWPWDVVVAEVSKADPGGKVIKYFAFEKRKEERRHIIWNLIRN